jgi:hypothetical protein
MTDRDGGGRSGSKGDVMPSSRVVRHIHRGSRFLASRCQLALAGENRECQSH